MATSSLAAPVAGLRPGRSLERMPRSPDAMSSTLESLLHRYRESVLRIGRRHGLSDLLLDEGDAGLDER